MCKVSPLATSQMRAVLSSPPAVTMNLPSGEKATASTPSPVWPEKSLHWLSPLANPTGRGCASLSQVYPVGRRYLPCGLRRLACPPPRCPGEDLGRLAGGQIPQPGGVGRCCGGQILAIRREVDAPNDIGMTFELKRRSIQGSQAGQYSIARSAAVLPWSKTGWRAARSNSDRSLVEHQIVRFGRQALGLGQVAHAAKQWLQQSTWLALRFQPMPAE